MKVDKTLWNQLMTFKQKDSSAVGSTESCTYSSAVGFEVVPTDRVGADAHYILGSSPFILESLETIPVLNHRLYLHHPLQSCPDTLMALRLYWPLVYLSKLDDTDLPFLMVHMAQSLDGKICTGSGKSKWIGNEPNLIHAHRVRACVDGVMVGGKTLADELPQLNVRHVNGSNPHRLFLSNSFTDYHKIPTVDDAHTFILQSNDRGSTIHPSNIDGVISFDTLYDLLHQLKSSGIKTIMLEGGAHTVSSFCEAGLIDWVQLHIAPIIFGCGKSFATFSGTDKVNDGLALNNVFYTNIGDAIMITGELDATHTEPVAIIAQSKSYAG